MDQVRERIQSCISALALHRITEDDEATNNNEVEEPIVAKERCVSLSVVELFRNTPMIHQKVFEVKSLKTFNEVPNLSVGSVSDSESSRHESESTSKFPSTSVDEHKKLHSSCPDLIGTPYVSSSEDEVEDDDVFDSSSDDSLDKLRAPSITVVQNNEETITETNNQSLDTSSSGLDVSQDDLDEEWELLEQQKHALWILHKSIKEQKNNVLKSRANFESKIKEIVELQALLKEKKTEKREMAAMIKRCKENIEKMKADDKETQRITDDLHLTKKEAVKKLEEAQTKFDSLKAEEAKCSEMFSQHGSKVKVAVDKRTILHQTVDSLSLKLHDLETADGESGIDLFGDPDPLQRIESEYTFYPKVEDCDPDAVGNAENPKECVKAMEKFVQVIRSNVHRFKHLPMGPLYMCARIERKRFSHLVEHVLRPYLFTLLVDNIVDSIVMEELIAQHFEGSGNSGTIDSTGIVRPKYFIYSFNSQYPIGSRISLAFGLILENLYDAVHFNDQAWGKFLSQKLAIEKIIFMENESTGFMLMSNLKRSPLECNVVYKLDGFIIDPFPKKVQFYPHTVHMKCFANPKIREVRTKIEKLKKNIESLDVEIYADRQAQFGVAEELDQIRSNISKLQAEAARYDEDKANAEKQLKKGVSVKNEKKALKVMKGKLKKIKEQLSEFEFCIDEKRADLHELTEIARDAAIRLDGLEYQFEKKENIYFEKREYVQKMEEDYYYNLSFSECYP